MTNIFFYSISIYLLYKFYNIIKIKFKIKKNIIFNLLLLIFVLWIVLIIIIYPKNSVQSALNGLNTWFNIVLPSLLPFFIISEILVSIGVVDFISVLLQPITAFLFRVPGEGSFVFAMSVTSGYPVGAKLISKLRLENKISKIEGQRLLSFCSTSGPLFMIGAVSVGMFKNASIGPLIAISHYLGALTIGFIFRFYKSNNNKIYKVKPSSLSYAFRKLLSPKKNQNSSLGAVLSNSVKESMNTMFMIGGFIILYSVVIEALSVSNVFNYLSSVVAKILPSFNNTNLLKGFLSGFVEITIGCNQISLINNSSYVVKVSMVSLLIGWSGLSIHSQVMSFISHTDLDSSLYFLSKALHGLFSSIYTFLLFDFFIVSDKPVSSHIYSSSIFISSLDEWMYYFKYSIKLISYTLIIILVIGLVLNIFKKLFK